MAGCGLFGVAFGDCGIERTAAAGSSGGGERGRWAGAFGPGGFAGGAPGKATRRGRREDALRTTSHERVENQGCPHCAGREIVGWGRSHGLLRFRCKSCEPLADQHPDGASAQEGALARSRPGEDRGQKSGQDRSTVRRPSDNGVSLAPSVSPHTRFRQAADVERDRRSRRDLRPGILQGPLVRPAAQGAAGSGIRAFTRTTSPSPSPAT
jgi:hypothetical protein